MSPITYGAITQEDAEVLEAALSQFKGQLMRVLEIGTYHGATSRGIRDFCAAQGSPLEFWGIEAGILCVPEKPFPEANFIIGESREVFMKVPDGIHVLVIDADHSFNAVVLDILHYGRKVVPGGFMLLHDVSPLIQYAMEEPNRNYPEHKLFHNAVNDAITDLGLPHPQAPKDAPSHDMQWFLFASGYNPSAAYGGMVAYKKG